MNWFTFKEIEPENYVPILVSDGENVWSAIYDRNGETVYFHCHGYGGYEVEAEFGKPLYWAELPKPPSKLTKRVPDRAKSAVKKSSSVAPRKSTRRGR